MTEAKRYQQNRLLSYFLPSVKPPAQPVLQVEKPSPPCHFYPDKVIFPLHSGRGALQKMISAKDTGKTKRRRIVYESLDDADLFLDGSSWTLSKGFEFTVK